MLNLRDVLGWQAKDVAVRILGSLGDLVSMSIWTVVATLLLVGFSTGRLIERRVRSRDLQRAVRRG